MKITSLSVQNKQPTSGAKYSIARTKNLSEIVQNWNKATRKTVYTVEAVFPSEMTSLKMSATLTS